MTIELTQEEYSFFADFLQQKSSPVCFVSKNSVKGDNTIDLTLDDDIALDIREDLGSEVGKHFDENYKPTKTALVIESLIDKLFF